MDEGCTGEWMDEEKVDGWGGGMGRCWGAREARRN